MEKGLGGSNLLHVGGKSVQHALSIERWRSSRNAVDQVGRLFQRSVGSISKRSLFETILVPSTGVFLLTRFRAAGFGTSLSFASASSRGWWEGRVSACGPALFCSWFEAFRVALGFRALGGWFYRLLIFSRRLLGLLEVLRLAAARNLRGQVSLCFWVAVCVGVVLVCSRLWEQCVSGAGPTVAGAAFERTASSSIGRSRGDSRRLPAFGRTVKARALALGGAFLRNRFFRDLRNSLDS